MPLAYFSTWTTYGTWLPGDPRGWYERGRGLQLPNPLRQFECALKMTEKAVILDIVQCRLVEETIKQHCAIRKWTLHAVSCRSNHAHVLVSAPEYDLHLPREQFKAWCTRRLKEHDKLTAQGKLVIRENYWTQRGWDLFIDSQEGIDEVSGYIEERQGPS